ncbi:MAG: dockerin type I domain-containing protein [Bacilli bacterium]|nr:dockerin type I domain-containing protein [Bacilli bacterium]
MKNILKFIVVLTLISFIIPSFKVLGVTTGYITKITSFKTLANEAGTNVLLSLDPGDKISILSSVVVSTNTSVCVSGYYQVSFYWENYNQKTYTGYVCADNVQVNIDVNKYAEEFTINKIPQIYWEKLTLLKDLHPNWIFKGYETNLDWNAAISAESNFGMSAVQSSNPIYLSLDQGSYDVATNTYNQLPEGGGWYYANKQTVAYYMDPRNFLTEKEIFMFENLGYNAAYQTLEVVQNILKNTALYNYANIFIEAATYNGNNISPVSLAASARQEVVTGDGTLSNSANGNGKIDGISYYNVYNIGAASSCESAIACGINYASGYIQTLKLTTYSRPWTTIEAAIKGGAEFKAQAYINKGQNTIYFKKYNVTSNKTYSNQYMTNVAAAVSEGVISYNGYSKISGLLDNALEFTIPVYNNMPTSAASLPTAIDQEALDKAKEEANSSSSKTISEIIIGGGYTYNTNYITNIGIGSKASLIISNLTNSGATVNISTTNSNGTYNLSGDSKVGTGDIITITSGNTTESFRIVIKGDADGDGSVNAVDYVKVRNYIMGSSSLNGSYKLASDVNNDGSINAVDYVNIKNYIMGNASVLK